MTTVPRRYVVLIALCAILVGSICFIHINRAAVETRLGLQPSQTAQPVLGQPAQSEGELPGQDDGRTADGPAIATPLAGTEDGPEHPVERLIRQFSRADKEREEGQSRTLEDAVKAYQQRYGMPPPPHFDDWYRFAKQKNVKIIDEYDGIYDALRPFWGLRPSTIRRRAREVISYGHQVVGVMIRNHKITRCERRDGEEHWLPEALEAMTEKYTQWLPDMDLAFNQNDEPRVVVAADELDSLHQNAQRAIARLANASETRNGFSPRPGDVNRGDRWYDVQACRFTKYDRQRTWEICKQSCPLGSPARPLEEDDERDDRASYSYTELGFVNDTQAHTDVCRHASLQRTFGLFERPNVLDLSPVLMPIFSQSKMSTFQDILYPSPWYWNDQVPYTEKEDKMWDMKQDRLFWRGTTTGGFSRAGGWRHHHRQIFVGRINGLSTTRILDLREPGTTTEAAEPNSTTQQWHVLRKPREDYRDLFDVKFTEIKHCEDDDCDAQNQYFEIVEREPREHAYAFKHVLDIDGHGFSGRFYAFLHSHSLPFKLALFREWHDEWIRPWVHYVPLSQKGDEHVELMRYFSTKDGDAAAEQLARQGRHMAKTMLRKEDMEVWWFRLLLE
ncbi:capsule-associated protein CAP1 [Ascosphaera acerosa]|nr:capsule-associated protein CAP1 [Ascosphaera acerosa]